MRCLVIDDDEAVHLQMSKLIDETDILEPIGFFADAEQAATYLLSNKDVDVVFLDVELPKISGIELLSLLQTALKNVFVIVVSSKERYAVEAFYKNVSAYILKPLTKVSFLKAVDKVKELYNEKHNLVDLKNINFFVKSNDGHYVHLNCNDIYWIEVNRNDIWLHTANDKFQISTTLKEFTAKLPQSLFVKTHRSFVVNINRINMIYENEIIIKTNNSDVKIPLSRNYKSDLLGKINLL